jgi:uncharacterized protein YgiM (DUF1202 family)
VIGCARRSVVVGILIGAVACSGGSAKSPAAHSPSPTPSVSAKPRSPLAGDYSVTATPCVNMRKQPVFDVNVIECVPNGAVVTADGQTKKGSGLTWLHVTYKKRSGWIADKYLHRGAASSTASP